MLQIIFSIIGSIYAGIALLFFAGLLISKKIKDRKDYTPFVSVIIAARNEEVNISKCLKTLSKLVYDKNKFEIILVNDDSTDNTEKIIKTFLSEIPNLVLLNTKNFTENNLKGKVRALDYGISKSKGEIILMTDADCVMESDWIRETIKYYDDNTAMVCGVTVIKPDNNLFTNLQSLDWLYLQSIGASSCSINLPTSCIGNNLSIRKSVYEKIGGYKNIAFSVTEDLALFRTVNKLKDYNVKYPLNTGCLISTLPCVDIKELYHQKKRWFRGGTGLDWYGYLLGFEMYVMNFFLLFGYLFFNLQYYLIWSLIKVISDFIIVYPLYKFCSFKKTILLFPFFQIYFAIYGLSLPFTFLTGKKINWKNRTH